MSSPSDQQPFPHEPQDPDEKFYFELGRRVLEPTLEEVVDYANEHGPPNWQESAVSATELYEAITTEKPLRAFVLAADLRKSTALMKEADVTKSFGFAMSLWIALSRLAIRRNGGWFERFTGDGFLAYWLWPMNVESNVSHLDPALNGVINTIIELHENVSPVVLAEFRKNSRNFPVEAGQALGVDSGAVTAAIINADLALVGPPVVGAVRMVDKAAAGETLCNNFFGGLLSNLTNEGAAKQGPVGAEFRPRQVSTKEYPEGQHAFQFLYDRELVASARRTMLAAAGQQTVSGQGQPGPPEQTPTPENPQVPSQPTEGSPGGGAAEG